MKTKLPDYEVKNIYTGEVSDSFDCDEQDDVEKALLDLKIALTTGLHEKVESLHRKANKWEQLYNDAISTPCKHKHLSLTKDDKGTHFACSCCGKVMKSKQSAEAFILDEEWRYQ